LWLSFYFLKMHHKNMLFSSKFMFPNIYIFALQKNTDMIDVINAKLLLLGAKSHDLPYLGMPFSSKCNCLINVFFCMFRWNSLRVRPRAGRRDGEPLGDCATSGRWVSQSIGRLKNRCRWDATCLGKFATAGRGGCSFSPRSGRGVAAATVETHLRSELSPKAAI